MALSLNKLVYDILQSLAGTSLVSDDTAVSNELIEYKIINTRAFLIRQDLDKGRSISANITQTLECVPISEIDVSLCPCNVPSDCTVWRTDNQIPKPLELKQRDLIIHVAGVDITSPTWSILPYARVNRSGVSKWTKDTPKVFYYNGYIYGINLPIGVKYISIQGVFEDPVEVAEFAKCDGTPCYTRDDNFPISGYMIPVLKQLVLKDFGLMLQIQQDDTGDERFNKGGQKAP